MAPNTVPTETCATLATLGKGVIAQNVFPHHVPLWCMIFLDVGTTVAVPESVLLFQVFKDG